MQEDKDIDTQSQIDIEAFASIVSLVHYISNDQDADVETIEAMLCAALSVSSLRSIGQHQFEQAMSFLADLKVTRQLN